MPNTDQSTLQEIGERFDKDMKRFSNLETGQLSIVDAIISIKIITEVSKRIIPNVENLLYMGCSTGNLTLMMLSKLHNLNCSLVDLSKPMLDKECEGVRN